MSEHPSSVRWHALDQATTLSDGGAVCSIAAVYGVFSNMKGRERAGGICVVDDPSSRLRSGVHQTQLRVRSIAGQGNLFAILGQSHSHIDWMSDGSTNQPPIRCNLWNKPDDDFTLKVTLDYDRGVVLLSVDRAEPTRFPIPADWTEVPTLWVGSSHRACVFTLMSYVYEQSEASPSIESGMGAGKAASPAVASAAAVASSPESRNQAGAGSFAIHSPSYVADLVSRRDSIERELEQAQSIKAQLRAAHDQANTLQTQVDEQKAEIALLRDALAEAMTQRAALSKAADLFAARHKRLQQEVEQAVNREMARVFEQMSQSIGQGSASIMAQVQTGFRSVNDEDDQSEGRPGKKAKH